MDDKLIVLNANLGRTNVIEFDEFSEIAIDTANKIREDILPLCGSDALQNLIIYRHIADEFMKNVFSNDGMHILKSTEYLSPIQTYIANYLRYVAERVERAAADGTSTAIYMGATLISTILKDLQVMRAAVAKDNDDDITRLQLTMHTTGDIANHVTKVLTDVLDITKKLVIDISKAPDELKRALIYQLAYTTSKGNEVLTQYAVDLFVDLPELLYEQTNYKRSQSETEQDLIVDKPDHDLVLNVLASNNTQYNNKLSTELLHEDCDLLVVPNLTGRSAQLIQYLESRKTDDVIKNRHLVIVYTCANDADIIKLETNADPNFVTVCRHTVYHPVFANNPLELHMVQVVGGIDQILQNTASEFACSVIMNVGCRIYNKNLYISNLFEHDTLPLHPSYVHGYHASYNKLRLDIEERITQLKAAHNHADYAGEINEFTRIYRSLICSKLPILTIGGSTINHIANIDIVNDVLGVVSVAMKHGVILDYMPKLVMILKNCLQIDYKEWLNIFAYDINDFCRLTYRRDDVCPKLKEIDASFSDLCNYMFVNGDWTKFDTTTKKQVTVVQSYRAVTETISRLIETIPRFMCTDRIIVQNSVMGNTKEE